MQTILKTLEEHENYFLLFMHDDDDIVVYFCVLFSEPMDKLEIDDVHTFLFHVHSPFQMGRLWLVSRHMSFLQFSLNHIDL